MIPTNISEKNWLLVRLREHLINSNVPGLRLGGSGLGDISNERACYTESGSIEHFDVPSIFFLYCKKKTFLRNRTREDTQSPIFQKTLNRFQYTTLQYHYTFWYWEKMSFFLTLSFSQKKCIFWLKFLLKNTVSYQHICLILTNEISLVNPFRVFFLLHEAVRNLIIAFHSTRSSAKVSWTTAAERTRRTQSFHVFFGLLLGRRRGASISFTLHKGFSSPLRYTCPNQAIIILRILSNTLSRPQRLKTSSLKTLSRSVTPHKVLTFYGHILESNFRHAESVPMPLPHTTSLTCALCWRVPFRMKVYIWYRLSILAKK